jgi:hypothetical protein
MRKGRARTNTASPVVVTKRPNAALKIPPVTIASPF